MIVTHGEKSPLSGHVSLRVLARALVRYLLKILSVIYVDPRARTLSRRNRKLKLSRPLLLAGTLSLSLLFALARRTFYSFYSSSFAFSSSFVCTLWRRRSTGRELPPQLQCRLPREPR